MVIRELSRPECLEVLAGARLARLGCVKDNRPYIVPVYIACDWAPDDEPCLYGFATPGQKVEWMRANPLVCVEVDDVTAPDCWTSVIVSGRYEELPDTMGPGGELLRSPEVSRPGPDDRLLAYNVLRAQAEWWQPGSTAHLHPATSGRLAYIYYRVNIDQISGHRATPDAEMTVPPAATHQEEGWLRRLLHFVR